MINQATKNRLKRYIKQKFDLYRSETKELLKYSFKIIYITTVVYLTVQGLGFII